MLNEAKTLTKSSNIPWLKDELYWDIKGFCDRELDPSPPPIVPAPLSVPLPSRLPSWFVLDCTDVNPPKPVKLEFDPKAPKPDPPWPIALEVANPGNWLFALALFELNADDRPNADENGSGCETKHNKLAQEFG